MQKLNYMIASVEIRVEHIESLFLPENFLEISFPVKLDS